MVGSPEKMFEKLLVVLVIASTGFVFLVGGDDNSELVLKKSGLFWITGPQKSVAKLQRLYDLDVIAKDVARQANLPVVHGNITLLNGWDFFDVCGKTAEACTSGNDIYLQTGYAISNVMGLTLAHEMSHYYTRDEREAEMIACAVFPDYEECYNILPRIR